MKILTLSGCSGSGKSTQQQALLSTGRYGKVVTTTTRAQRPGELDGVDYHFVDKQSFETLERGGELIEKSQINQCWYGMQVSAVKDVLTQGKIPLVVCDPQGAIALRDWAQGESIEVVHAFVHVEESKLAMRLMDRAVEQIKAGKPMDDALSTCASRIDHLYTVERLWREAIDYQVEVSGQGNMQEALRMLEWAIQGVGDAPLRKSKDESKLSKASKCSPLGWVNLITAEQER